MYIILENYNEYVILDIFVGHIPLNILKPGNYKQNSHLQKTICIYYA